MQLFLKLAIIIISLLCLSVEAADRLRVGLALSGGGARGIAHIGVLKELERQRIPIDFIAGTSMGAIVGGLYASGKTVEQIEQLIDEIDWDEMFRDQSPRKDTSIRRKLEDDVFQFDKVLGYKGDRIVLPSGFIQGQKLQLLLDRLFLSVSGLAHFDQFPIPFRAVATDITTGKAVILEQGSLAIAIRASMSVPSVFSTVKINDVILVDGGISNNLPIDVVRNMGADVVIAVDIGTPLLAKDKLSTVLNVSIQLSNLLVRNTTDKQIETLTERDILIVPELGDFSSSSFNEASDIIVNGSVATRAVASQLELLAVSLPEIRRLSEQQQLSESRSPVINFIEINNNSSLDDEYIRARLTQKTGAELNFEQLEKDIAVIHGLDIFSSVTYEIVQREAGNGLLLNAVEKPWGPRYLQFGLSYASEVSGDNDFTGLIGLTVKPFNASNGEWRSLLKLGKESLISTELYQPLAIDSPYYTNGNLAFSNELINNFVDGVNINQTKVTKRGVTLALGREINQWGDLRAGFSRFHADNEIEVGLPDPALADSEGGEAFILGRADTLDNTNFPSKGIRGLFKWTGSRTGLGADSEFDQIKFDYLQASSLRKHTILLGARYFSTFDGVAPINSVFRLGGLFDLPGFSINELSGQHLYLLRAGYQRKLQRFLGTKPYLGFTLQNGNVFNDESEINFSNGVFAAAIWLGWDTLAGPFYVSYGRAETGQQSVYLLLGRQF